MQVSYYVKDDADAKDGGGDSSAGSRRGNVEILDARTRGVPTQNHMLHDKPEREA